VLFLQERWPPQRCAEIIGIEANSNDRSVLCLQHDVTNHQY